MRMDHRPREIDRANEEFYIAVAPQRNEAPAAFVRIQPAAKYMHRKPSDIRRERDDQVMVTRLLLILVVGLRPLPEAWPTLAPWQPLRPRLRHSYRQQEHLAVDPPPSLLGLHARLLVELMPFDPGLAEIILKLVIEVSGECSTCFLG